MSEFTDITVLLDRSGSMSSIKDAMESAFKEFLIQHRKVPTTRLTLIQFDSDNDQEVVFEDKPVQEAPGMELVPRGGTPLVDAFVKAIDRTGRRLADLPERDRPDQVLFVVITDGQENASRTYKRKDVFDRVSKQRNDYKWQFIYLGANQDAIAEAATYGIGAGQTITWNPTLAGTQHVNSSMRRITSNYTTQVGSARGQSLGNFTTEDQTLAMAGDEDELKKKLDKSTKPVV